MVTWVKRWWEGALRKVSWGIDGDTVGHPATETAEPWRPWSCGLAIPEPCYKSLSVRHEQCIGTLKVTFPICLGVKKVTGISLLLHNELAVRKYLACLLFCRAIIAQIVCTQNQNCHTQLIALATLTCSSVILCKSISCLTPRWRYLMGLSFDNAIKVVVWWHSQEARTWVIITRNFKEILERTELLSEQESINLLCYTLLKCEWFSCALNEETSHLRKLPPVPL